MRVSYFPIGSSSYNDRVRLSFWTPVIKDKLRRQFDRNKNDLKKLLSRRCEKCGTVYDLQIHHKKPVWVYSLEIVLSIILCQRADQIKNFNHEITKQIYDFDESGTDCNSISNLETLCKRCHNKRHRGMGKYYREYFEKKYRVVFGVRNYKRETKLMNKNVSRGGIPYNNFISTEVTK